MRLTGHRCKPAELKANANRAHARRRAAERYGLSLSDGRLAGIEEGIREGREGFVILRPSGHGRGRALYGVTVDGPWLPAVFDPEAGTLVTFLPESALDPYRRVLETSPVPTPFVPEATGFVAGLKPVAVGELPAPPAADATREQVKDGVRAAERLRQELRCRLESTPLHDAGTRAGIKSQIRLAVDRIELLHQRLRMTGQRDKDSAPAENGGDI